MNTSIAWGKPTKISIVEFFFAAVNIQVRSEFQKLRSLENGGPWNW